MIVAAPHATFGLPEPSRGIIAAGGGAVRLPRRLPRAIACELLLTGATIDAEQALRWGLVNRVVGAESVLEAGLELAQAVDRAAPVAVAATMAVAQASETVDEASAWAANDNAVERVRLTDDAREGPRPSRSGATRSGKGTEEGRWAAAG